MKVKVRFCRECNGLTPQQHLKVKPRNGFDEKWAWYCPDCKNYWLVVGGFSDIQLKTFLTIYLDTI